MDFRLDAHSGPQSPTPRRQAHDKEEVFEESEVPLDRRSGHSQPVGRCRDVEQLTSLRCDKCQQVGHGLSLADPAQFQCVTLNRGPNEVVEPACACGARTAQSQRQTTGAHSFDVACPCRRRLKTEQ